MRGRYYLDRYISTLPAGNECDDIDKFRNNIVATCYVGQHINGYDVLVRKLQAYSSTIESFDISWDSVCDYIVKMCETLDMEIASYEGPETILINDDNMSKGTAIIKSAINSFKRRCTSVEV